MSNVNRDISGIIAETRKIIAEGKLASTATPKQLGYGGNLKDWTFLDKDKMLRGQPIASVIDSWLESFTREETQEWVEKAQCFLPVAAQEMKEAEITPDMAATIAPAHVGRKSYKDTVGYKVACGDLDVDEAMDFIKESAFVSPEAEPCWDVLVSVDPDSDSELQELFLGLQRGYEVEKGENSVTVLVRGGNESDAIEEIQSAVLNLGIELDESKIHVKEHDKDSLTKKTEATKVSFVAHEPSGDIVVEFALQTDPEHVDDMKNLIATGEEKDLFREAFYDDGYWHVSFIMEPDVSPGSERGSVEVQAKKEFHKRLEEAISIMFNEGTPDWLLDMVYECKKIESVKKVEPKKESKSSPFSKRKESVEIVDGADGVDAKKDNETWPMASIQAHVPGAKDAFAAVNALIDSLKDHAAVKMYDPSYDGEGFVLTIVAPRAEVEEVREAVSKALESAGLDHKLVFSEIEKLPEGNLVEFGHESACLQCAKPISEEEFERNAGMCDECSSDPYGGKGPGGHEPDGTGPHGSGDGPGGGRADGSGLDYESKYELRTVESDTPIFTKGLEEKTVSGIESEEGTVVVIPPGQVKSGAQVSLLFNTIMDFESVKAVLGSVGEVADIGKRDAGYWASIIMTADYDSPLFAIRDIENALDGKLFVKSAVPAGRMAASVDHADDDAIKKEEIADEYGQDDDEDTDDFTDDDLLLSDDEEDISERTLDSEPPDFQPGDAVTVDMGEGTYDAIIADGDEDNPYRKKHDLFGELDVDVFLIDIVDEEAGETVQTYVLAALLK